jgi:hypothetical protein
VFTPRDAFARDASIAGGPSPVLPAKCADRAGSLAGIAPTARLAAAWQKKAIDAREGAYFLVGRRPRTLGAVRLDEKLNKRLSARS